MSDHKHTTTLILREAIARSIKLAADLPRTRDGAIMLTMLDCAKHWLDRVDIDPPAEQPERETDSGDAPRFELARCRRTLGQIYARVHDPDGSLDDVQPWTDSPGGVLVAVQQALDRAEKGVLAGYESLRAHRSSWALLRLALSKRLDVSIPVRLTDETVSIIDAALRERLEQVPEPEPELTPESFRRLVALAREVADGDESLEQLQEMAREALTRRRPN